MVHISPLVLLTEIDCSTLLLIFLIPEKHLLKTHCTAICSYKTDILLHWSQLPFPLFFLQAFMSLHRFFKDIFVFCSATKLRNWDFSLEKNLLNLCVCFLGLFLFVSEFLSRYFFDHSLILTHMALCFCTAVWATLFYFMSVLFTGLAHSMNCFLLLSILYTFHVVLKRFEYVVLD